MNAPGHRRRENQRGAPQVWCTPPALVRALEERYTRDGFDLDVAATAENAVAEHWLGPGSWIGDEGADALEGGWGSIVGLPRPTIFCNPPWNAVPAFVRVALAEAHRCEVIVLVLPTRADTEWWAMLERGLPGVIVHRDQIAGRVAYLDPLGRGRSAPAEGTTVWVLRPQLRAEQFRERMPRTDGTDGAAVKGEA